MDDKLRLTILKYHNELAIFHLAQNLFAKLNLYVLYNKNIVRFLNNPTLNWALKTSFRNKHILPLFDSKKRSYFVFLLNILDKKH